MNKRTFGITKKEAGMLGIDELLKKLDSSANGLSAAEASRRLALGGLNQLSGRGPGAFSILGRQFKSSLTYLLVVACLIAFGLNDYSNGTIIAVILFLNTGLGFFQEYRSERIVEKLSKFIQKEVLLKRGGEVYTKEESEVVPGDVMLVKEGDIIVADMRLMSADDMEVNESQLTGESQPVVKNAGKDALLFSGSVVEKGQGVGVVYATGDDAELGAIASLSTHTKKETQYEKSLQSLSSLLMRFVMVGLASVFILKFFIAGGFTDIAEPLLFIIAMAVATVPEVLPVIATVSLSIGALRLARKHVVVKHLPSVEDLGNITLLCTDKTGTITENKMTISEVISDDTNLLLELACASSAAGSGKHVKHPNSYDEAFMNFSSNEIKAACKRFTLVKEVSFDPAARRSRTILFDGSKKAHYLVTLGSAETLLAISENSKKEEYTRMIASDGREGIRDFGIAYKEIAYDDAFDIEKHEKGLIFLGYAKILDPLRPEASRAIEKAKKIGVAIKILTGDSREVAEYAGREVGLIGEGQMVYTGDELEAMSEEEFKSVVNAQNVFARVSPSQKYHIIEVLKENNVVAYQGDGINDAPSLKLADVSIAVNHATDIAKENADIVLLRKNLEVVVDGIMRGRAIFMNINKYIKYTMVSNFGNLIALSVLYLVSQNLPLLAIQILLISVITDIPLISISADTVEGMDVIRPEKHDMRELLFASLILGIPTALFELAYFFSLHGKSGTVIQTNLYLFLMVIGLIVFYSVRSKKNAWNVKAPPIIINGLFGVALSISVAVVYVPELRGFFAFVPVPVMSLLVIMGWAAAYFVVIDLIKAQYYKFALPRSAQS